jgi:uncharacterized membrane protein YedE/YeeE
MNTLIYGLVTGMLFGFLLQRGSVLRYDRQLGALRFMDMTIVKFMFSTVMVGMIGVYALLDFGLATLSVKPTILGAVIPGGLIFGLGWGLLGYCPGTSVGALAEGRLDGLWGVLGMLAGAALFAEAYPALKKTLLTWGIFGKITLPQMLGVSPWIIIFFFIAGGLFLFYWLEKKRL